MMKQKRLLVIAIVLSIVMVFTGCSAPFVGSTNKSTSTKSETADDDDNSDSDSLDVTTATFTELANIKDGEYYEDYTTDNYTEISFTGSSADVNGDGVSADGSVITITEKGTYVLTGTLDDGQVVVNADEDEKVKIILNDVSITNSTGAAFVGLSAKKIIITNLEGTTNTFADGEEYADTSDEAANACIYSETDLVFNGTGTLTVNANYNNGIQSKDKIKILEGTFNITSKDDAIVGRDRLVIANGTFNITSGGDGFKSTNEEKGNIVINDGTFSLTCDAKGINSETNVVIFGGSFDIVNYGGYTKASAHTDNQFMRQRTWDTDGNATDENEADDEADDEESADVNAKAIKAGNYIVINGGEIALNTSNDGLHADNEVIINDGNITIDAGDDGIHGDVKLTINGGNIAINNSYEGVEAPEIYINDGEISVTASDDGINAAGGTDSEGIGGMEQSSGYLYINGGNIHVNSGGDGLDSNTNIEMTAGYVLVEGPVNDGNGALDYGQNFNMTGGTLIAIGSSGMLQTVSDGSTVPALTVVYSQSQSAGSVIKICDSDGNEVFSYESTKNYQAVTFASDTLTDGGSYSVYKDDEKLTDVTISGITNIDDSGNETTITEGMGGFGGRGGMKNQDGNFPSDGDVSSDGNMPNDGNAPSDGNMPDMNQDSDGDSNFRPGGQGGPNGFGGDRKNMNSDTNEKANSNNNESA